MRFIVSRTGKLNYYLSKYISAMISGGLSILIGFIIYSIVVMFCFKNDDSLISEYLKIYFGMLMYGVVSVFPAFFLSAFIKNKCILCCFPFILMHFYYTSISKLQDWLNSKGKDNIVIKMVFLYPSELKEIMFRENWSLILYNLILFVITIITFSVVMNRRFDCGE